MAFDPDGPAPPLVKLLIQIQRWNGNLNDLEIILGAVSIWYNREQDYDVVRILCKALLLLEIPPFIRAMSYYYHGLTGGDDAEDKLRNARYFIDRAADESKPEEWEEITTWSDRIVRDSAEQLGLSRRAPPSYGEATCLVRHGNAAEEANSSDSEAGAGGEDDEDATQEEHKSAQKKDYGLCFGPSPRACLFLRVRVRVGAIREAAINKFFPEWPRKP